MPDLSTYEDHGLMTASLCWLTILSLRKTWLTYRTTCLSKRGSLENRGCWLCPWCAWSSSWWSCRARRESDYWPAIWTSIMTLTTSSFTAGTIFGSFSSSHRLQVGLFLHRKVPAYKMTLYVSRRGITAFEPHVVPRGVDFEHMIIGFG